MMTFKTMLYTTIGVAVLFGFVLFSIKAPAREYSVIDGSKINWAEISTDLEVRQWINNLKMPDQPRVSCCGEADAYWADSFESIDCTYGPSDGEPVPKKQTCYVAIITDDRPDSPLGRHHREIGEKFTVPNFKIKSDEGNPTGHAVVFLNKEGDVLCYVPGGGV